MSDASLQNLIETLKQQGIQSGEETSRQIVGDAQTQAQKIVAQAQKEAEAILSRAKLEAEKTTQQLHSSLEITASQFITTLKRTLEQNLLNIPLSKHLQDTLSDKDFLKKLMLKFVEGFGADPKNQDSKFLLDKENQQAFMDFAKELIGMHYGKDSKDAAHIQMQFVAEGVSFGFMVDRDNGHVQLDFTDQAFLALFLRFLSPRFREFFKTVQIGETPKR